MVFTRTAARSGRSLGPASRSTARHGQLGPDKLDARGLACTFLNIVVDRTAPFLKAWISLCVTVVPLVCFQLEKYCIMRIQ